MSLNGFRKNVVTNLYTFQLDYEDETSSYYSVEAESKASALLLTKSWMKMMHESTGMMIPLRYKLVSVKNKED